MQVAAGPLAGHGGVGVLRRTTALLSLGTQRLVMLLRRFERVRAHDRVARIVAVAVTPRGRRGRIVADRAAAVAAPLILDRRGAVAAEVAWIAPQRAILVEVLRGEEIHRERSDPRRRGAI